MPRDALSRAEAIVVWTTAVAILYTLEGASAVVRTAARSQRVRNQQMRLMGVLIFWIAAVNPACGQLIGTWRLESYEVQSPGSTEPLYPYGRTPSGSLIYDANGSMAVQIMGSADRK